MSIRFVSSEDSFRPNNFETIVSPKIKNVRDLKGVLDTIRLGAKWRDVVVLDASYSLCSALKDLSVDRMCVVVLEPNNLLPYEYKALIGVSPKKYPYGEDSTVHTPWVSTHFYKFHISRSPWIASKVSKSSKLYRLYSTLDK